MTLNQYIQEFKESVRSEIADRLIDNPAVHPYEEIVFSEMVMAHLSEIGMLSGDYETCYYSSQYNNGRVSVCGYSFSEDGKDLDLAVCIYRNTNDECHITNKELTDEGVQPCLRFLLESIKPSSRFLKNLEQTCEAYPLAMTLNNVSTDIQQIRIFIITDCITETKQFKEKMLPNKTSVRIEVMDMDRLYKQTVEGSPLDEIAIDFTQMIGAPLPCVYVPSVEDSDEYSYILTAIPGEVIYSLYKKYRDRLLESNVRSFLSTKKKANAAILETLLNKPSRFMALNNGLVMVADRVVIENTDNIGCSLSQMIGFQIVNGGQTSASIFFAKKQKDDLDLSNVRVQAKIIVLKEGYNSDEKDEFVASVSKSSNLQTAVKDSDFLVQSRFHIEFEKIVKTLICPDGVGKWFYERATGSFNTYLSLMGSTPTQRKKIKTIIIPPYRKLTKTDLALSIAAWDGYPLYACKGGEKNVSLMQPILESEADNITVEYVKMRLAQYAVFRQVFYLLKGIICKQSPGTVRVFLIYKFTRKYTFDFNRIWSNQGLSEQMKQQFEIWGEEIYNRMLQCAEGRQLSEFSKTEACVQAINSFELSESRYKSTELKLLTPIN